jgi:hypothetical protein
MLAYIVLLLAVFSRFLPHLFHATAWNFTAIGGGLLFFGSRMRGSDPAGGFDQDSGQGPVQGPGQGSVQASLREWLPAARLLSAVALLAAADFYLTVFVYQYPFHVRGYVVTWLWYAAICLLGMGILRKPSVLRVGAGALAASTSFFLISNFMVWLGGAMYPRSLAGLGACYIAGIPFYRNDLVSTALTAGALFGLPVLAARIAESLHATRNQPLA